MINNYVKWWYVTCFTMTWHMSILKLEAIILVLNIIKFYKQNQFYYKKLNMSKSNSPLKMGPNTLNLMIYS